MQQKDVTLTRRARPRRHSARKRTQVFGLSLIGTERRHLDKTSKDTAAVLVLMHKSLRRLCRLLHKCLWPLLLSLSPCKNPEAFPSPLKKALQQSDTLFRSVGVDAIQPSFAYAFARMRARVHLSSARLYPPQSAYSPHTEHTQVKSWA